MTDISEIFFGFSFGENIHKARKFFFTFLVDSSITVYIQIHLMLYKPCSLNYIVIFKTTLYLTTPFKIIILALDWRHR